MKAALKATAVSALLGQQHADLLAQQQAELEALNAQFHALDSVLDRMDKVTTEDRVGSRIRVFESRRDYRYRHWPKDKDPVPRALTQRKAKDEDFKQVSRGKLSLLPSRLVLGHMSALSPPWCVRESSALRR